MNYLAQGFESREKIDILLDLTSFKSEAIKAALVDYFCRNMKKCEAALVNDVKESNLNRDIKKLNITAGKLERCKELDWPDYQALKQNEKNR